MSMQQNLFSIFEETRYLPRVLDVGGAWCPLSTATHIIDTLPNPRVEAALSSSEPIRFSETTFVVHDICRKPWPFPDHFFDYSFCNGTLEDLRDPVAVCEELMRVSKRGYIGVPSRVRECFHHKSGYIWRRLIGRPLRIGFGHHRWLCEAEGDRLTFTVKPGTLTYSRKYFITRDELGRDLTPQEAWIDFYWSGSFQVSEHLLIKPGETEADFIRFKQTALAALTKT